MTNMQNTISRRQLLSLVGKAAGGAAMYQAMTSLGFAAESTYNGPLKLQGAPKNTTILILGAGIAGLVAAYELKQAGYQVKVLEYNKRAGGRSWTIRGGDEYTELGGAKQRCEFDQGHYINPGPWRIPYNHHAILDYAKRLNVPLEPFIQVNYNAYLHAKKAYGGKPQRYRQVQADYHGYVAELLGKAVNKNQLDAALSREDQEKLLESLKSWGALDKDYRYLSSPLTSDRRGYDVDHGGGLMPEAVPSQPLKLDELLQSGLWQKLSAGSGQEFQSSIFQPVGGMDQIAQAVYRQVASLVQFNAKVTKIEQGENGVTVTYNDADSNGGTARQAKADWLLCTIPLSILSEIEINVSQPLQDAIQAVPYENSVKVGLQFKRRFWEQDEHIYGGISYTDQAISTISYPSTGYGQPGKGVLLGAYIWGPNAYEFGALTPQQRVQLALQQGAQVHPQYLQEFDNGVAVSWNRVPFINGCFGTWTDELRKQHYKNLCQIDGRIVLAGEHASYIPAWQEGAVLSSLDAITRLHARIKSKV
ncbi:flavin monoamine oxidase family protein [Collimonas sp. NPDC087041]|uniref:flavin monoamine oxidase family protein n=1 Tax=Collimonas sp. NPDC087041 TaxID=3363960 RepID=UPI00380015B0